MAGTLKRSRGLLSKLHAISNTKTWTQSLATTASKRLSSTTSYSYKTHSCGELTEKNVDEKVTLCGWVEFIRSNKFLTVRDFQGSTQILLDSHKLPDYETISPESVLKITGTVTHRPEAQRNTKMATGAIEVIPDEIEVLNRCNHLPFRVQKFAGKGEELRHRYRYLDIRTIEMQHNLRQRAAIISKFRSFLEREAFIDVETPTLCNYTPGGATEFVVPSAQEPGKFYCLPQSPQVFKQLLMVGGIDRYYQVARCYRNESIRTDRQLEFTQLDLEMSFVTQRNIMDMIERMFQIWPRTLPKEPFQVITYDEAMTKYGTDKPDLLFDYEITEASQNSSEVSDDRICKMIYIDDLSVFPKDFKTASLAEISSIYSEHCPVTFVQCRKGKLKTAPKCKLDSGLSKELLERTSGDENTAMCLSWGEPSKVQKTLGRMRDIMCQTRRKSMETRKDKFLWVVDFPLFEVSEENDGTINSNHHPFTSPHPDDIDLIKSNPVAARAQAYDLVLNGQEVGGGSIRIHNPALQREIFEVLNIDCEQFGFFLEALDSGAPPHGGIALGLDRLFAELCNTSTIRDIIAFPKNSSGRDSMIKAPSEIDPELIKKYHITPNKS